MKVICGQTNFGKKKSGPKEFVKKDLFKKFSSNKHKICAQMRKIVQNQDLLSIFQIYFQDIWK